MPAGAFLTLIDITGISSNVGSEFRRKSNLGTKHALFGSRGLYGNPNPTKRE